MREERDVRLSSTGWNKNVRSFSAQGILLFLCSYSLDSWYQLFSLPTSVFFLPFPVQFLLILQEVLRQLLPYLPARLSAPGPVYIIT